MDFSHEHIILQLSLINGIGPVTIEKIFSHIPLTSSWDDLKQFTVTDWQQNSGVSQVIAQRLVDGLSDERLLEKELAALERHAIKWMTFLNADYPPLLRAIHAPPSVLYWYGDNILNDNNCLAIIGSRQADNYARNVINTLVPSLVVHNFVIVSGGAIGADSMAHEATLDAGGKTVVIVGSGLLNPYPARNASLFKRVIENGGMLLSIFPCAMTAQPGNFPARNRVISGVSRGCLVIQAAQQSGTHITATYALEQGRDVFAVPGLITDPLSIGCHRLIQEGSKLVTHVNDILSEFGYHDNPVEQQTIPISVSVAKNTLIEEHNDSSDTLKQLLRLCSYPQSLDDLIEKTNFSMQELQMYLFQLQLDGYVQQDFTGRWVVL